MNMRLLWALPAIALLLAGCVEEPAAFLIEGGNHSLTVERKKPYFWSDGWELDLIVARYPECQRRYPLHKASDRKFRIDLYQSQPGVFIVNQNNRWYIAETRDCRMQEFDEEPPEPGQYLGNFREKNEVLAFVPYEEPEVPKKNGKKPAR